MGDRIQSVVRANAIANHAFQVLLARRAGLSLECYSGAGFRDRDLESLVEHQYMLLREDPAAIREWAGGRLSSFDPGRYLGPLLNSGLGLGDCLPVNVAATCLALRFGLTQDDALGVGTLLQLILEIERDGTTVQDLLDFYTDLGLPLYVERFGPSEGLEERLLAIGEGLSAQTCPSPFATDAPAWQIAALKVLHWAQKKTHIRDHKEIAAEVLRDPGVQRILPQLGALPAQRIAVVGDSYTMMLNWSTPAPFTWIDKAIFEAINPGVTMMHFGQGGMRPCDADRVYGSIVLEFQPHSVFFFVIVTTAKDIADLSSLVRRLSAAGIRSYAFAHRLVDAFDSLASLEQVAMNVSLTIIDIEGTLKASPQRSRFMSLDGIHMTEAYHRLAAIALLNAMAADCGRPRSST